MKKWQAVFVLLTGLVIAFSTSSYTVSDSNSPDSFPKHYSRKQVDSVMSEWSVSLGVKCSYCHARNTDTNQPGLNFDSDKKPEKLIAKRMYKMTADLNATYFNFNNSVSPDTIHMVICYTCHRGRPKPDDAFITNQLDSLQRGLRKD